MSMAAEWMRKKSGSLRKLRRLMSRIAPLPPSDCTCVLNARAQELPVRGWVGEGGGSGDVNVLASVRWREDERGRRRAREHAPHLHTHPQEVRVEDQVLREKEEVAGHNRLPDVCDLSAHEPHVVHARLLDEPRRVHRG